MAHVGFRLSRAAHRIVFAVAFALAVCAPAYGQKPKPGGAASRQADTLSGKIQQLGEGPPRGRPSPDFQVRSDGGTLEPITNPDPDYDCRHASPGSGVFDWRSTIALEHCVRIVRLARLSRINSDSAPPQFFQGTIDASRLPTGIGVSMPLLRVVFPQRVFFDTDGVALRPEARDVIEIIARFLEGELPDVALFIAGHADQRGSNIYNLDLSSRRANAIAEAIVMRRGSRGGTVWRVGFGEDMPLYAGDSEEALGFNRRIEFYFASRADVLQVYVEQDLAKDICLGADCRATIWMRASRQSG